MTKTYKVKAIFGPTLQGEGSAVGTVVHFVRFSACNMWDGRASTRAASQCPFCDTNFLGGEKLTGTQILARLESLGHVENVVLSGGEPLLQVDDDLTALLAQRYTLHVETNGTRRIPDNITHVTVSPKVTADKLVADRITDLKLLYPPIRATMTPESFAGVKAENYFLQPIDDAGYASNLKATIEKLKQLYTWRLSLQTHKITGVP